MEFVFIGLAVGCAAFLFKIVSEYLSETPIWQDKIEQAETERVQYEGQLEAHLASKNDSAAQAKQMDQEIKSLEQMRDDLKSQIETKKKEMARQGKIIMKRQSLE
ncbi:MAG: flagellar biosynthesis chaperone FliJ [Candidatus Latescibacterota bacterium]|jgi:flagellar biosynthesis chaperone FliJ